MKKQPKNSNVERVQVSLRELNAEMSIIHDSPASMKLKLINSGMFTELPSIIDGIFVPSDTKPSSLGPIECMNRLMAYAKKDMSTTHPTNTLSRAQVLGPVSVFPNKIINYEKAGNEVKEVTYESIRGFLFPKDTGIIKPCAAIAADLIVSCVATDKNGDHSVIPKDTVHTGIPSLDLISFKRVWKGNEKNPAASRDKMYFNMTNEINAASCLRTHSECGFSLPNYVVKENLSKDVRKAEIAEAIAVKEDPPPEKKIKICVVDTKPSKYLVETDKIWTQFSIRQAITGDNDPSKVYCGYNRFSMNASDARLINTVQDILMVCDEYKCYKLALMSKSDLSLSVTNALVCNGIYIIYKNDIATPYSDGCKPGIYQILPKMSAECVHFFNYNINDYYPTITSKGVAHKTDVYKSLIEYADSPKRPKMFFFYAVLNEALSNLESYAIYPCVAGERMRVLMLKGLARSYALSEMYKRASLANWNILAYPYTRRPFFWVDPLRDVLNYKRIIRLPQAVIKREKEDKFTLMEFDIEIKEQDVDFDKLKIPQLDTIMVPVPTLAAKIGDLSPTDIVVILTKYKNDLETGKVDPGSYGPLSSIIEKCRGNVNELVTMLTEFSSTQKPYNEIASNVFGITLTVDESEDSSDAEATGQLTGVPMGGSSDTYLMLDRHDMDDE